MRKIVPLRPVQNVRHGWFIFRNRRALMQMFRETLTGHYHMSFFTLAAVVLSIAYIIFPLDIVPDFIPVLGWIDDGLMIFLLLKRLTKETQRYNRFKAMERKG
jgi:uncharacterized membrane protein YkvA (DUF1232 family)